MSELLSFTLGPINLGSVLMLLESDGLTGSLSASERLKITVLEGQIVGATCGPLEGVAALRTLFFLRDLQFAFQTEEVPRQPTLVAVVRAIIDCARLQDDWARLGPMVLKTEVDINTTPEPIHRLLRRLDGTRPLQRAVVELGLSPALIVDPLLDLYDTGKLVEVGSPVGFEPWPGLSALRGAQTAATGGSDTRALADEEFERSLAEGRTYLREGDLDLAETAFLMALDLRPDDRIAAQNLRRVRQLRER